VKKQPEALLFSFVVLKRGNRKFQPAAYHPLTDDPAAGAAEGRIFDPWLGIVNHMVFHTGIFGRKNISGFLHSHAGKIGVLDQISRISFSFSFTMASTFLI
jgi:hypothetical protein